MEDQTRIHQTGLPPRGETLMLVAMLALAVVWTFSMFYALVVAYPSGEDRGMSQRCRGGGCQAASLARSLFQFQGRS
jgi:hypothetical protein